jgi:hypothetical protein
MSVFVDDVDEVRRKCVVAGLDVTFPPTDMPWNIREMHVRYPDGHVFRVGKGIECEPQKWGWSASDKGRRGNRGATSRSQFLKSSGYDTYPHTVVLEPVFDLGDYFRIVGLSDMLCWDDCACLVSAYQALSPSKREGQ